MDSTPRDQPSLYRSVRFPLHPDDVLLFIHIPKTGGLSLISVLEEKFTEDQIFPLHSAADEQLLSRFPPSRIAACRLVRGHFVFGPGDRRIYQKVVQHPVMLTMLRDPVARTVSAYHYIRRDPRNRFHDQIVSEGISLHEFVERGEFDSAIVNRQTRMLAVVKGGAHDDGDEVRLSDNARLFLAKEKLEQCAFVGLTERFRESLELLAHTFGWAPLPERRLNRDPQRMADDELGPATRALIESKTALDRQVYAFACDLFDRRMESMRQEKPGGARNRWTA